jgi:predicted ATPase/transcriptional regulator with XRE-family HTH domain
VSDAATLGSLLRRYRERVGLTQEMLAERAGLAGSAIAALERGRRQRPYPHTVQRLADALGLAEEERTVLHAAARAAPAPESGKAQPVPLAGSAGPRTPPPIPSTPTLTGLPAPLTSFLGRTDEVAQVAGRLAGTRLLTLTGPGGCGKTRLAIEAARAVEGSFKHGASFVDLAPIGDVSLVLPAIARATGVREAPGQSLAETLAGALRERNLLLVLDNFEQVLDAAPLVTELLRGCAGLTALVTSRVPLRVSGEQQYRVQPLATPDPARLPPVEVLAYYPSVALFAARAAAIDPDFVLSPANAAAVAEICCALDGLPLAIEVAAARSDVLPPAILARRLAEALPGGSARLLTEGMRDLPARQLTLHATLDWSYNLLDEPEQRLFRRLGAFAGGWTVAAVEEVCADALGERQVWAAQSMIERLDRLVDHSLIVEAAGSGTGEESTAAVAEWSRYRMLETVREFAREQLAACGEQEPIEARHTAYFVKMAEASMPLLRGPEQQLWLARLDADHDNLRAVLARGEVALARTAGALTPFWEMRGYLTEGRRWLETAAGSDHELDIAQRARLLSALGRLAAARGDLGETRVRNEAALALYRQLGEPKPIADALTHAGLVAYRTGEFKQARERLEEALTLYWELGDEQGAGHALNNLGVAAALAGDFDEAQRRFEEVLAVRRALDDTDGIARALLNLGSVAIDQGAYGEARERLQESMVLWRSTGGRTGLTQALSSHALALFRDGERQRARAEAWEAIRLARATGMAGMAWNLIGLVGVMDQEAGHHAIAVRLTSAALAQVEAAGGRIEPLLARLVDDATSAAHAALGEPAFTNAQAEGRALSLEQAIDAALAEETPHRTPRGQ